MIFWDLHCSKVESPEKVMKFALKLQPDDGKEMCVLSLKSDGVCLFDH